MLKQHSNGPDHPLGKEAEVNEKKIEKEKDVVAEENKTEEKKEVNNVVPVKRKAFVGLLNQGATCYLNSLLQSMYFTPELREGLYSLSDEELGVQYLQETEELENKIANGDFKCKEEDVASLVSLGVSTARVYKKKKKKHYTCIHIYMYVYQTHTFAKRALAKANNDVALAKQLLQKGEVPSVKRVVIQLRQLFAQMQCGDVESVSTKEITKSFGWLNKEATIQHDAHELNRILLDALERSIVDTPKKTLINDIFQGTTVHRTLCLECSKVNATKETFLDILVEVENLSHLKQSLDKNVQPEFFVGDNQYFCEHCARKTDAKRTMAYRKLPPVLTVSLKRFVFDLDTLERIKYKKPFAFPLVFDFDPFMEENLEHQIHRTDGKDRLDREMRKKQREDEEKKKKMTKINKVDSLLRITHTILFVCSFVYLLDKNVRKNMKDSNSDGNNKTRDSAAAGNGKEVTKDTLADEERTNSDNATSSAEQSTMKALTLPGHGVPTVEKPSDSNGGDSRRHDNVSASNPWGFEINDFASSAEDEEAMIFEAIQASLAAEAAREHGYAGNNSQQVAGQSQTRTNNENQSNSKVETNNNNTNTNTSANANTNANIATSKESNKPTNPSEQFKEQSPLNYQEAHELFFKHKLGIGIYDFEAKVWKTVLPIQNDATKQQIVVRYIHSDEEKGTEVSSSTVVLSNWPAKNIQYDPSLFKVNDGEALLEKWSQDYKKATSTNPSTTSTNATTTTQAPVSNATPSQQANNDNTVPAANNGDTTTTTDPNEDDWSKKTDFSKFKEIGYLCDNGIVAAAEIHTCKPTKMFIYFIDVWQRVAGEKYTWIDLPNPRLRPKPTAMPPEIIGEYGSGPLSVDTSYSMTGNDLTKPITQVARPQPTYKLEPSKYDPNSKNLYVLTGVVIHSGSPYYGHYHTYIRDFLWEGPRQKTITDKEDAEKEKQNNSKCHISKKKKKKKSTCIEDAEQYWYDFNDSHVSWIDKNAVAKQYGGDHECAYILVYRRWDQMNPSPVALPLSLQQYINEYNLNKKEDRIKAVEESNAIEVKILLPSCFQVNPNDNSLTMQPFVDSLLKQFIRTGRMKQLEMLATTDASSHNNATQSSTATAAQQNESDEKDIEEAFMNGAFPENLNSNEVESVVAEWFRRHTLYVKVDGRKPADTLLPLLKEEFKRVAPDNFDIDKFQLHFIAIPQDRFNQIPYIASLRHYNVATYVSKQVLPLRPLVSGVGSGGDRPKNSKNGALSAVDAVNDQGMASIAKFSAAWTSGKNLADEHESKVLENEQHEEKEVNEDGYHFQFSNRPTLIRDMHFQARIKSCFVWDGKTVNGVPFNLQTARQCFFFICCCC
ncbi:hypothetical protein RFI_06250 [Reticulomyxa filosa]|uniref:USP domain-containing protein n=1 Tax=Reticulomyxa filosa TaxID=46433 RepID=X6P028_RETFI|nr:hypothetical protein RFI_06250 [Reticulomyxa filosa]|eukprot:ETO30867.1 hypothetical protein RFI_06250 [Reticulomyxa filosa]